MSRRERQWWHVSWISLTCLALGLIGGADRPARCQDTAPPVAQPNGQTQLVPSTNNEAERTLRGPAQARATGRTSKTLRGARRQTILTSVLESLRLYLAEYTIGSVLTEIKRWSVVGRSCFAELLGKLKIAPAEESTLDRVFSPASG